MRIEVMLCLPRDEFTIPVLRHIAVCALSELEVTPEATDDVALALTEACANVVKHSGSDDEYEVHLGIDEARCEISVVDRGQGFETTTIPAMAGPSQERGRGLALMRALVDGVQFESQPEDGTVVRLVKTLPFRADGPLGRAIANAPPA